jgi:phosphoglycerate dehydrogenase-like enzyme
MIEVLVTFPLTEALITKLRGVSPKLNITIAPANKPEDISVGQWEKAEILFTEDILPNPEKSRNLKWIQFTYSGIDRWVEHATFKTPGLQITTLSGAAVSQIAEHTVMMMLALGHKFPAMMASQRKSEWPKDRLERFQPVELRGSTVGLIGYGSIGRQIARLLEPFGATILALKRDAKSPEDFGFSGEGMGDPTGGLVQRLYPAEALRSVIRQSDFIVACLPLTNRTQGLLGSSAFSVMKAGAYLIDISRGKIIDHASLIKALHDGKIAGAALDVFPEEPLPTDNPLWAMQNVIITPHIADNSQNYEAQACDLFSENLLRYLAGLPLFNLFNAERGY